MRRFLFRLANVFRRDRADDEVAREINAHVALLEDDYRRRGMTADEARFAARRALGSAAHAQDLHRDARTFAWMDDVRRDVAHGLRSLRRTPGFSAIAVITLALGIGANTAIFSVVNAVLLRSLPYRDADRLIQVFAPAPNVPGGAATPRAARALAAAVLRRPSHRDAHGVACRWPHPHQRDADRAGRRGETRRHPDDRLGVSDAGRAAHARPRVRRERRGNGGADAVVVLSHATWRRYFNSDPAIVGRVAAFDGRGRTVVGVMPEGFAFPDAHVQYRVPYVPPAPKGGAFFSLTTLARLNEGVAARRPKTRSTP